MYKYKYDMHHLPAPFQVAKTSSRWPSLPGPQGKVPETLRLRPGRRRYIFPHSAVPWIFWS